ncbi:MAG: hypothetical protein HOW73_42090 [Polyangiaceae bacterium]|nr:hypothetical protein [Polyangiaceae bacterium]
MLVRLKQHSLIAFAVAAVALVAQPSAWAQPADQKAAPGDAKSDDPAVLKAREQFREGVALMAAQDWASALVKFKAVGQVRMNAQVAFNIAECERELGKLVSALGNYRLALAKAQDGTAPKVAEVAPQRITEIEPRIAKLKVTRKEPKPNPRALIDLDGAELGPTQIGADVRVDPGERVLRVVVDGKVVKQERVKLGDGESKEIAIEIPAPTEKTDTSGGGNTMTAEASGPSIPGIVLTAFGGASIVAGAVFIGLRQQAISDLDELCGGDSTCPASAEETYDRGRLMTGLAEVFFPVGAAATVTGIVLIATMSGKSDEPAASDTPAVSFFAPDGQGPGLTVTGTF